MGKQTTETQGLFQFAFIPKYEDVIKDLADNIASPDQWDFSDTVEPKYSILKNYLEHTYRKLRSEQKIAFTSDNKNACFNTGLVSRNYEEIYAFFEQNKDRSSKTPYFLKGFVKKSNFALLKSFKSDLPQIANFFDKPELLIFNPQCELIPDIDHIIEDNIDRFPLHLKNEGEDEIRRKLQGAIDEVKKRVKTNYKIAIPQFYNNQIQLLLPLCLTPNSKNPDLALVVHKIDNKTYTARTCLTLKMAYNNARLIVKPESSWLKP